MPKLEQNPTEFEQNYRRASLKICEGHLARIGMLIITMCGRDYGCAESYFLQLDALIAPNAFDNLRIALILAGNYANGDKHCLSGDKVLMSGDKLTTNDDKVSPSGDKRGWSGDNQFFHPPALLFFHFTHEVLSEVVSK